MAHAYQWRSGNDGTRYYVDSVTGAVAGMVRDAGNGSEIYKVGFGVDFVKLYYRQANAVAAVEAMAAAEDRLRSGDSPGSR